MTDLTHSISCIDGTFQTSIKGQACSRGALLLRDWGSVTAVRYYFSVPIVEPITVTSRQNFCSGSNDGGPSVGFDSSAYGGSFTWQSA
jgi:hypothetical protein